MARSVKDSLSDEAQRFVKEGFETSPAQKVLEIRPEAKEPPPNVAEEPAASTAEAETTDAPKKRGSTKRRNAPELPENRVPLSTRMKATLVYELKRAGLRRELDNSPPYTVQSILEVAAEEWLRKNSEG